jgi:hypothetical protein
MAIGSVLSDPAGRLWVFAGADEDGKLRLFTMPVGGQYDVSRLWVDEVGLAGYGLTPMPSAKLDEHVAIRLWQLLEQHVAKASRRFGEITDIGR